MVSFHKKREPHNGYIFLKTVCTLCGKAYKMTNSSKLALMDVSWKAEDELCQKVCTLNKGEGHNECCLKMIKLHHMTPYGILYHKI